MAAAGHVDRTEQRGSDEAEALMRAVEPLVGGLAATFGPYCEVVLHDFRHPENSIRALSGSVTSRHVGGAMSEIGLGLLAQGDQAQDQLNYTTRIADGRTVKSSTIVLRTGSGQVVGALCVNLDITELRVAATSLAALVGSTPEPEATAMTVFSDDIGDVIETVIAQEESLLGRVLPRDTRKGRLAIIGALDSKGVFNLPRAAQQVAAYLNVSRATVYADLNAARGTETGA
ncbi:helix-turn-helix transcriptional regulator [Actinacidiphila oryziradicis]|uniref:Transcriptional regulator n=1 Tax=Actinacidiphila oryziradicis TaxID=2571141 RepID=A0A4U0RUL7_9ACTN|nr:PAS domain-containing protein [Actinacidiphila oryziradicis]TJZ99177.1 transcriptional regulator [Actinacidiphila oryziradicis]